MRKRIVLFVVGVLLLGAVPALPEMTCEAGHIFMYNGHEYCNPGGDNCLHCWEEIVVGP
jgi:hypothetical protein